MSTAKHLPYVWDYDITPETFQEILDGRRVVGRLNQDWAARRLIEYASYEEIVRLIGFKRLVENWRAWRRCSTRPRRSGRCSAQALFLGERARPLVALPFAAALVGMALASGALAPPRAGFPIGTWEGVALASSILSGAAVAAVRAARRSEGSWAIYGSFTLCGVVVTAPFALADWRWPDAREWTLLVAVGLASVAAQLLMTHAYRWVTNLQAGVVLQLNVVATMALGALLLGERLAPSQLVGAGLALAGVVGVIVLQRPPRALE